jgi:N-dimethylarginine dimethylaminohydrolase
MCSPDYFSVSYSINPWMDTSVEVNQELALNQWNQLKYLIEKIGGKVELIDPQPDLPDMVFTANAGFIFDINNVIISSFAHKERQGEEWHFQEWFINDFWDVELIRPESDVHFEGAGDMLKCGEDLYCGYGFRSDKEDIFDLKPIFLELSDPHFYHLDTCFCPLREDLIMYYPGAFKHPNIVKYNLRNKKTIEVPEEDAKKFACNAVVIDDSVIIPEGADTTQAMLEEHGFKVYQTPMSEYIKSGGACKCLTLKLDLGTVS